MAVVAQVNDTDGALRIRKPKTADFVRLKLRLLGNGFRGQPWRVVAFVVGLVFAASMAALAALGLLATGTVAPATGATVASLAGAAIVLAWAFVPLLFFGVDETLDPARFALLPVSPSTLARGMLAAAFVGIPAVATLVATSGLVAAAAIRFGAPAAVVALFGIVTGLTLGVVASRAVTSAFAELLRSRRMRDLAAVVIALLASSIGPIQLILTSVLRGGDPRLLTRVAAILGWTPMGAPYLLAYDVAAGRWIAAGLRTSLCWLTIALLLWWWSRTIESAMLGATTAGSIGPRRVRQGAAVGAVATLIPGSLRRLARPTAFGAILARESRFWWRDPRRRASLVSILVASAFVPLALNVASAGPSGSGLRGLPFSFAVTMSGTIAGMLLGNQFAFDADAYATHLLSHVPGRLELRARAVAMGLVAVPIQICVVVAVTVLTGRTDRIGAGLGMLAAGFGSALAVAALLSVLAPYALPDNANPFALNSGGGGVKGLLAMVAIIGTLVICMPIVVAAALLSSPTGGWVVLLLGLGYGIAAASLGTYIGGDILDRRGPEVLIAVTPRR